MVLARLKRQHSWRESARICSLGAVGTAIGSAFGGPVGGAIGGAIGSAIEGQGQGGGAAQSAGFAQTGAGAAGAAGIQRQFDITRQDLSPFRSAADPALAQFQALLGLPLGGREITQQEQGRLDQLLGQESQLRAQERDLADKVAQSGTSHFTRHFAEAFGPQLSQVRNQLAELDELRGFSPIGSGTPEAIEARRQEALGQIQESPGQQFIRKRAQRNLLQNASAIGGLGGGNVRTALVEQGAGFASQDLQNQFARLQSLISGGQQAATAGGALGAQAAQGIGQFQQAGGQARAGGILGAQQANAQQQQQFAGLGGAVAGLFNQGGFGGSFGSDPSAARSQSIQQAFAPGGLLFSDERLKTDITEISPEDCYNAVMSMSLKAWRYLEETGLDQEMHMGVMAQDAPECIKGNDVAGYSTLNLNDELTLIVGALQHAHEINKVH